MKAAESRLQRWENLAEWPLAGCAAAFLVLYSVQVLARPARDERHVVHGMLFVLYVPFVIDYVARLMLAEDRLRWFFRHLLDLAIVALPFLGPLRLLRLVVLVGGAAARVRRCDPGAGRRLHRNQRGAAGVRGLIGRVAGGARRAGGPHHNFGDAVWWSVTTITTVGYGDFYPVTAMGKVIAALLMIGGISLIGTITATVATWIVRRVADEDTAQQAATVAHIEELQAEIGRLAELVSAQNGLEHQLLAQRGDRSERTMR